MVSQLNLSLEGLNGAQIIEQCLISKNQRQTAITPVVKLLQAVMLGHHECTVQLEIAFKDAGLNHLRTLETDFKSHIKEPAEEVILTKRELEICYYIWQGLSYTEIATKLNISPVTVRHHRANIYEKLHVKNAIDFAKRIQEVECFRIYKSLQQVQTTLMQPAMLFLTACNFLLCA